MDVAGHLTSFNQKSVAEESIYYEAFTWDWLLISVTRRKLPNVYKSCPKIISLEKLNILTPLQKLPKKQGDLGKLIVAKGFKKWRKVK